MLTFVPAIDTDHVSINGVSPVELLETSGTFTKCVEDLPFIQIFSKCPLMEQFLHTASTALHGCLFWYMPLPHLQQMSLGNGTFLPFPPDLEGFPLLPLAVGCCWNFLDLGFDFLFFPY